MATQARLLLVRHGPTAETRRASFPGSTGADPLDAGPELDTAGWAAAQALAGVLPDADRVWSSHAARALGTAAAAGFADPERRAELAEVDFGRWRGRSIEDVARAEAEALRAWFADPDGAATPHGGEDHVAVRARLRALMSEAAAAGGTTIAFTHGGLVRAAVIEAVFPGDDSVAATAGTHRCGDVAARRRPALGDRAERPRRRRHRGLAPGPPELDPVTAWRTGRWRAGRRPADPRWVSGSSSLGGTRSGKSAVAESLVSGWPVCYVATGTAVDGEMAARIAAHRARRPAGWLTLETTELSAALTAPSDHALLIDSLGGWVTAALWPRGPEASEGTGAGQLEALAAFWEAAGERASPTVVVAEDAGSGLVATDPGTRSWVDLLGDAAQTLAATADRVILVVAGRPVDLPPAPTHRDPSSPTPRLEGAAAEGRDGVEVVGEAWLREHGDRQGWAGALDLAVNVKAGGVPRHVAAALAGADVTRYPDDREAREAVARRWGRRVEEVGVTAGASEAFWLLPRVLPARLAAVVHPAFTEPEAALRAAGVPVVRVLRHEADGWRLDPSAVPDEADLVVVGNPNNPTGTLDEPATIASLARPGRTLVVDEAFMDYVADDGCSLAAATTCPGSWSSARSPSSGGSPGFAPATSSRTRRRSRVSPPAASRGPSAPTRSPRSWPASPIRTGRARKPPGRGWTARTPRPASRRYRRSPSSPAPGRSCSCACLTVPRSGPHSPTVASQSAPRPSPACARPPPRRRARPRRDRPPRRRAARGPARALNAQPAVGSGVAADAADADDVGPVAGDVEAVAGGDVADPALDGFGGDLLDAVAGLADEVVVVRRAAAAEGLLALAGEGVEEARLGQGLQRPVDGREADAVAGLAQLHVQVLRGDRVVA